jgi:hypothetical protein
MSNHIEIVETGFYGAHESTLLDWIVDTTEDAESQTRALELAARVADEARWYEDGELPDWEDALPATEQAVAEMVAAWPVPITRERVTVPWPGGHTLPAIRYSIA